MRHVFEQQVPAAMNWARRSQLAFKTGVAVVIAYGLGLWMGWANPLWAGLTVLVISQATVGLAINKGALRIAGALVGIVVAFILIALFAQERWLFILGMATHLAVCAYMMGGQVAPFFWFVAGFAAALVGWEGVALGAASFDLATVVAQQTLLGVSVVTVVAALLWPRSSGGELTRAVQQSAALHVELFRLYAERFCGGVEASDLAPRRLASLAADERAASLIDAAETDTYRVWEARRAWSAYRRGFQAYWDALGRWRQSFEDAASFDAHALLPALDAFLAEIGGRLETIEALHRGERATRAAETVQLAIDERAAASLSEFDRTVLEAARVRLVRLEQTTRGMLEAVRAIYGLERLPRAPQSEGPWLDLVLAPDPSRLNAGIREFVTVWLAGVAYLLLPDVPGGSAFIVPACFFGIPLAVNTQMRMWKIFLGAGVGVTTAAMIYMAILPHLVAYQQLATVLFAVVFFAFLCLPEDKYFLPRTIGLAFVLISLDIENVQPLTAQHLVDSVMMVVLILAVLATARLVPCRTAPAAQIDWLLARFRRSAIYLLKSLYWADGRPPTVWHRAWRRRHLHEVSTIALQLVEWNALLPRAELRGGDAARFRDFIYALSDFGFRLVDLVDARARPQAPIFLRELGPEMISYRLKLESALHKLTDADSDSIRSLGARSIADMRSMQHAVEDLLRGPRAAEIDATYRVSLYRLLGVFREVVASMSELVDRAATVDWQRLREARF